MEVVDKPDGKEVEKIEDDVAFTLSNNSGGFCLLSNFPKSRMEGIFFREKNKLYKVIDQFKIHAPVTKLINELWNVTRERNGISENFFMPIYSNSLVYSLSEKSEFDLILDCKEMFDNREWGRKYEISKEGKFLIIKFSKTNDDKEDNAEFSEFDVYIAIYSDILEYKQKGEWEKEYYEIDHEREDPPSERYVYNACKIRCKEVVFAFSTSKKNAIMEAKYVWRNKKKLKQQKEEYTRNIIHRKKISDSEIEVAYQCALNAIDSLKVNDINISAGWPWFYESWARDELISLKSLINMGQYSFAKKILFKQLKNIGPDGKIETRDLKSNLKSNDAPLWLFKRFEDYIDALEKNEVLKKYLSKSEIEKIFVKLNILISQWMKYYMKDALLISEPLETWMDTDPGGDPRTGAMIEIQALFLSCLRLLRKLGGKDKFESELLKKTREMFWNGSILSDGALDTTIRPNIFIAAYVYPELLQRKEWRKCFISSLRHLWLSWGGLASIDKKNSLYTSQHTGKNIKSYHRGDSWYWINNLAAIVMHRIDKKKFKPYINKILKASTKEILYSGITGCAAEVSSAAEMQSKGCRNQAWSNAMYIELIDELYK